MRSPLAPSDDGLSKRARPQRPVRRSTALDTPSMVDDIAPFFIGIIGDVRAQQAAWSSTMSTMSTSKPSMLSTPSILSTLSSLSTMRTMSTLISM
jgi:hypothetical protein